MRGYHEFSLTPAGLARKEKTQAFEDRKAAVKVGDRFRDNDKRMGNRLLEVIDVFRPSGGNGGAVLKAVVYGQLFSKPVRIRLDRLVTPHLFTPVPTP